MVDVRIAVAAFALLAGCASTSTPPTPALPPLLGEGGDPLATAFTITNDASSLYRIDKVVLVLDGAIIVNGELSEGERARLDLGLSAGDHTLQMLVKASYPSGSIDERCSVELRAFRPFRVDGSGAEVAARIETGGLTVGFSDRVGLSFDLRGAREVAPADLAPAPSPEEEACAKLGAIRGAACSGEILLAEAEREGDVIKTLCYRDKVSALRSYASAFGETEATLAASETEPGGVNQVSLARRADLAAIAKSAAAMRDAMETCVSGGREPMPELTRTVVGEHCTGTDPFGDGAL